jgi:hypothetical protein
VFQNQSPHFKHEMLDDADEASVKEAAVEEVNYETKGNTVPSLLSTVWSKTKSSKKYAVTIGTAAAAAVLILALASGGNAVVRKKVSKVETAEIYSGTKSAKINSSKSSKSGSTTTTTRPTTSPTTGGGSCDGCQWQVGVQYCNVLSPMFDYTRFTTSPDKSATGTTVGLGSFSQQSFNIELEVVSGTTINGTVSDGSENSDSYSATLTSSTEFVSVSKFFSLVVYTTTWSTTACPAAGGLAGGN